MAETPPPDERRALTARDHIRAAFKEQVANRDGKIRTGSIEQQRREYLYDLLEHRMNRYALDTASVIWFQLLVNMCIAMPWPYADKAQGDAEWMETLATWLEVLPGAVLKTMHPDEEPH